MTILPDTGNRARGLEQMCRDTRKRLAAAGLANPGLDARLLVCAAAAVSHEDFVRQPDRQLGAAHADMLESMVARRLAREPVSRIVGEREFWGRSYTVAPATLDPRPDTETLVEGALDWLRRQRRARPMIIDLGTGTGCLLISLLCDLSNAQGIGVDIDPAATMVAAANARRYLAPGRASFVCGDWLAAFGAKFDLIVCNPPYVETAAIVTLEPEVAAHDPRRALDGGADGLAAYRCIATMAASHVASGGVLGLEIGSGQEDAVAGLLANSGFHVLESRRDLAGTTRCIFATPCD